MMWRMVLRRIGIGIVTLWVVSVLMFVGTEILPGDVAQIMLGQEATPENLAALREALGLNKPAWVRYVEWLGDMARFDLGMSLAGTTGSGGGGTTIDVLIGDRLQNTLLLAGIVAAISVPLSVALGLVAAMFPTSPFDRTVTFTTLCLVAVPEFFVATLLVLILAVQLQWLPAIATMREFESFGQMMRSLALPVTTLCVVLLAQMARMTRAAVLNVMSSPYIEMAILKGVPRRRIILRHALLNAIGPVVNIIALNLAYLVSGVGDRGDDLRLPGSRQAHGGRRAGARHASGAGVRDDLLRHLRGAHPDLGHRVHRLQPAPAAPQVEGRTP